MSKSSSKADAIGGSRMLPMGSPFPGFEEDNELHDKMQGRKVVLMEGMMSDLTERMKKNRKKTWPGRGKQRNENTMCWSKNKIEGKQWYC